MWPGWYATMVAERAWSGAFVTVPILKPAFWSLVAAPRARPGTVVPLSTATVTSPREIGAGFVPLGVVDEPGVVVGELPIVFGEFLLEPPVKTVRIRTTAMTTTASAPPAIMSAVRRCGCPSSAAGGAAGGAGGRRGWPGFGVGLGAAAAPAWAGVICVGWSMAPLAPAGVAGLEVDGG